MAERSEVLRVQNDALLNEYHQLIATQVRRIDEALAVLDRERSNLMVEREHLMKHLPPTGEQQYGNAAIGKTLKEQQDAMPKLVQKGPAT